MQVAAFLLTKKHTVAVSDEFKSEMESLEKAGFGDRPGRNLRMLRKLGSVDAVVAKLTAAQDNPKHETRMYRKVVV